MIRCAYCGKDTTSEGLTLHLCRELAAARLRAQERWQWRGDLPRILSFISELMQVPRCGSEVMDRTRLQFIGTQLTEFGKAIVACVDGEELELKMRGDL